MGTIVQEYGPIYGEAVNGTVQGRPNGSVYVPLSNTIALSLVDYERYVASDASWIYLTDAVGVVDRVTMYQSNANAQDLASYIRVALFSDNTLATEMGHMDFTSGVFTVENFYMSRNAAIVDGDTYYLVALLMNNGVAVATSSVIEVEGVTLA